MSETIINPDPVKMGQVFAAMNNQQQAKFFHAVVEEVLKWDLVTGETDWKDAFKSQVDSIRACASPSATELLDLFAKQAEPAPQPVPQGRDHNAELVLLAAIVGGSGSGIANVYDDEAISRARRLAYKLRHS